MLVVFKKEEEEDKIFNKTLKEINEMQKKSGNRQLSKPLVQALILRINNSGLYQENKNE